MLKKFIFVFVALLCMFTCVKSEAVNQSNFIDLQVYENIYKFSEDSDIKLPFIKLFNSKAHFDKKIDKSGLTIAANAVEITDKINGAQAIITSDTVDIKGSIEYGAILASNVMISGTIEKDLFVFADSVFITDTANILGDIIVISESIEMRGNIQGNFIANSTNFLMEGNVEKDFRVHSQKIEFNEANVKGEIYIETESDLDVAERYQNAVINKIDNNVVSKAERKNQIAKASTSIIISSVLFVLLKMVVTKINPELFKNLKNKVVKHSSYSIIMGLLLLVLMPIMLLITTFGIVFGLSVVIVPLFVIYVAILIVTIMLAKFILGSIILEVLKEKIKLDGKFKQLILMLSIFAILHIICYIPFIGWYITMAIILLSSGIVVTGITRKQ